jgi:hypothetical protein
LASFASIESEETGKEGVSLRFKVEKDFKRSSSFVFVFFDVETGVGGGVAVAIFVSTGYNKTCFQPKDCVGNI